MEKRNILLTDEEIKLIIAFMERADLTGKEVPAYNQAIKPLVTALHDQSIGKEEE